MLRRNGRYVHRSLRCAIVAFSGVLWALPAFAADPPAADPPPPVTPPPPPPSTEPPPDEVKLEARDVKSADEYQKTIDATQDLIASGEHAAALVRLVDVLDTGDDSEPYFGDAQFMIGVTLYHLGLFQSSYSNFEKVLDLDPKHRRYPEVLPWLVALHRQIPGETATLERLAEYKEDFYPAELKDEVYYYVGQFHYYHGTLKAALQALQKVTVAKEEFFLKARYLEGVVHVRNNNAKGADKSFKAILAHEKDKGLKSDESKKVHRMALLALARIYYTIGKYDTAVGYFDTIPEYSHDWLESLLEVSWAYFQLDNFGRSLGNLHTLNSPYFDDEYYPEAMVLEAVILNRTCHYEEALQSIQRFIKSYQPLFKELDEQMKVSRDPNQFYAWIARLATQGADLSVRLKRIFNAALADGKLNRSFRFIVALNQEIEGLKRLSQNAPLTQFSAALIADISQVRSLAVGETGALARGRLEGVLKDLRSHLAAALKVRSEVLISQKNIIDRDTKLAAGEVEDDYELDAEHFYWKFDGEYWKDELGSYTVGIASRCPGDKKPTATPAKPEPPKAEPPKEEPPKAEPPKAEPPKEDAPKADPAPPAAP